MLAETPRWVWLEWASRPLTDAQGRARQVAGDGRDHLRRAEAADLLVIGEGQMDGAFQALPEQRHGGQGQGDEALHVRGAAPVELPVALGQDERIAGPGLAVDRHHVGVARQDDPARGGRADAGQQVGLVAVGAGDTPAGDALVRQIALDPGDQGQVRQA
jgi:hypothetical protein